MKTIVWHIANTQMPKLAHHCKNCNCTLFSNSGCFRMNAQQKKLDVWLIYKCDNCNTTYNLEVYSRVLTKELKADGLYQKFLDNDRELANEMACDVSLLKRNAVQAVYPTDLFTVNGPLLPQEACKVEIHSALAAGIRLDKIFSIKTGQSRERIKKLFSQGILSHEKSKKAASYTLKSEVLLVEISENIFTEG